MRNLSISDTLAKVLLCRQFPLKLFPGLVIIVLAVNLTPFTSIASDLGSITLSSGDWSVKNAGGKSNAHLHIIYNTVKNFQDTTKITVTGQVLNSAGEGLAGASITVRNGKGSALSDIGGNFSMSVAENATLIVSYVGYKTQEVAIGGREKISIVMVTEAGDLGEVVVVGYTTQKRSNISGAISSVDMGNAIKRRVPEVAQLLQGQVPGVQVTQSTGAPGDPIEINIRGLGTLNDNSPLYIIDGVPSTDIRFLNPGDILSLTILKDASSAAIYGSRAAGGVVLITTKKGTSGKSTLQLDATTGLYQATNLPKLLNTQQYLDVQERAWANAGYPGTNPYTAYKSRNDLSNTDWLSELFETGISNNVQLSSSGGSENVQYFLSGGYFGQNGIITYNNDRFDRVNFRANINAKVSDRLTMGTNVQLVNSVKDAISSSGDEPGIIRHALIRPPVIPVFKSSSDPTYNKLNPFTDLPLYSKDAAGNISFDPNFERSQNPLALAYFTDNPQTTFNIFGNGFAEYALLRDKALKLKTNIGVDLSFYHDKNFGVNFGDDDGGGDVLDKGQGRINRPNYLSEERSQELNITWTNTAHYNKSFGLSELSALAGVEYISHRKNGISASRIRFDYTNPAFRYIDFGNILNGLWNGGTAEEFTLFSYIASASYAYDSKYLLTANFRADASTRFGPNNHWGYFPSVSIGWVATQEDFMQSVDWLNYLKIRFSIGSLGNQNIEDYAYLGLFKMEDGEFKRVRYPNPDIKWETTKQTNIGADLAFLNNKLSLSFDYYTKTTSGILMQLSLPALVGNVQPTYINAAEVKNSGIELGINFKDKAGDFTYSVSGNLATVKNEVIRLHHNLPNIIGPVTKTQPGHPMNAYFGYVMEGIYQTQDEVNEHLHNTLSPVEKPGYIKFKDVDNNGVIDDKDRDFMGNPFPKLMYGLTGSIEYKGFDFSMFWQGINGIDRYNDGKKIIDFDTRPFNHSTNVLNSWNGPGTSNTIPYLSMAGNGGDKISSIYVEDASYLRLKNVEIGYSFGDRLKKYVSSLRVYISAQNLLTSTKYSGLDPESSNYIDKGTYPQSRAFLFGVNVSL